MATTTCYRHPKRPTGASCTRCGRPICPDCMVEAPVGHHCPDCVRAEAHRVRRPLAFMNTPGLVVRALIAVNVLVYLLEVSDGTVITRFEMHPLSVAGGQYYRLITGAFLHAGILHIAFNMFCLWIMGVPVERAVGKVRFLALYLVSAVGGSVCSYWLSNPRVPGVGASGAVFGVFGAYFVLARASRSDTSQVVGLILVNLLFGFLNPQIDNWAHIGGLLSGSAVAGVYLAARGVPSGPTRVLAQAFGVVAVIGLLVMLVAVRTPHIPKF